MKDKSFILKIPSAILVKGTYAWLPAVALWNWPPFLSGLLALYLFLSLGILAIQRTTWQRLIREDQLGTGKFVYAEQFRAPARAMWVNGLAALVTGILAWWLMQGKLGLSGLHWFLLTAGYFWLEQFIQFVVFPPRHLITEDGVWALSTSVNGFIWFGEVKAVRVLHEVQLPRATSTLLAPMTVPQAVRLSPVNTEGFSEYIVEDDAVLFLNNIPRFTGNFSPNLVQHDQDE